MLPVRQAFLSVVLSIHSDVRPPPGVRGLPDQVLVRLLVTLQDRLRVLSASGVAQVPERELRSHVRRELPPEAVPTSPLDRSVRPPLDRVASRC